MWITACQWRLSNTRYRILLSLRLPLKCVIQFYCYTIFTSSFLQFILLLAEAGISLPHHAALCWSSASNDIETHFQKGLLQNLLINLAVFSHSFQGPCHSKAPCGNCPVNRLKQSYQERGARGLSVIIRSPPKLVVKCRNPFLSIEAFGTGIGV